MTFIHSLIRIRNPTHFLCYLVCLLLLLNSWTKFSCVECTFRGFKLHANFNQSLKQLQIICKGFFVCDFSLNCHPHKQQATCEDNLKTQCLNFVEKCLMPFSFQTKLVSPFVLLLYKVSSTTSAWFSEIEFQSVKLWNNPQVTVFKMAETPPVRLAISFVFCFLRTDEYKSCARNFHEILSIISVFPYGE